MEEIVLRIIQLIAVFALGFLFGYHIAKTQEVVALCEELKRSCRELAIVASREARELTKGDS